MKKILLFLLLPVYCYSQSLDGINVNLTLRSGEWAFIVGSKPQNDSIEFSTYRRMRDTIRLANPANFNTQIRMNAIPAQIVFDIYILSRELPHALWEQLGANPETQIKAIQNPTLQAFITAYDTNAPAVFIKRRTRGKNQTIDN